MEESIVKVENLSHRYTIQWAVRDINFEITRRCFRPYRGKRLYQGSEYPGEPCRGETPYRLFAPDAALAPGFDGDGVPGVLRGLASCPGQRDIDGREGGYGQVRDQSFQQTFDP